MTDTNVFDKQQETPATTATETSNFANQLSAIKNESGEQKYDTVEKALEGAANAQTFIQDLKNTEVEKDARIAALEEQVSKNGSIEDMIKELSQKNEQPQSNTTVTEGLDAGAVQGIVQNYITEQNKTATAETNSKSVSDALTAKYGDKTTEVVTAKAAELGMSFEQYGKLTRENPKLALSIFNQTPSTSTSPSTSSVTTQLQVPAAEGVKRPEKSVLRGSTQAEQMSHFGDHYAAVKAKYGVVT